MSMFLRHAFNVRQRQPLLMVALRAGGLTKEPPVEEERRILADGLVEVNSGMSMPLDMNALLLFRYASAAEVTRQQRLNHGVSKFCIAIEVDKLIDGFIRDG